MLLLPALLILLLPQKSHGSVDQGSKTPPPRPPPTIVYVNDGREYHEIRAEGGFRPASQRPSPHGYTLLSIVEEAADIHTKAVDTAYVLTSATFGGAARRPGKFVYVVHATSNMIDMARSLYNQSVYDAEFPAFGGIRWTQIIGWVDVGTQFHWMKPGEEDIFNGVMVHLLRRPKVYWSAGYHPDNYQGQTASGPRPELAGYRDNHAAWKERPWRDIPVSTRHDPELLARNFMASLVLGTTDRWMKGFPILEQLSSIADSESGDIQLKHSWRALRWRSLITG
ncbi:putative enterotoxin [Ophiocordyceps camponoti-floridani]|uniref:Putative enterotoxin n=1 Tax=Ophiocordyceps camponoti-floridani TaxID=2030778 RepID=A0A8H4Q0I1_9HYPO|nr:putative enterotoxin [Ophiocordyceps camponoti-floridani]